MWKSSYHQSTTESFTEKQKEHCWKMNPWYWFTKKTDSIIMLKADSQSISVVVFFISPRKCSVSMAKYHIPVQKNSISISQYSIPALINPVSSPPYSLSMRKIMVPHGKTLFLYRKTASFAFFVHIKQQAGICLIDVRSQLWQITAGMRKNRLFLLPSQHWLIKEQSFHNCPGMKWPQNGLMIATSSARSLPRHI